MNIFSPKTESLYVTLAVLECCMYTRLASSFQSLACLCPPSAGVKAGITSPSLVDEHFQYSAAVTGLAMLMHV